MDDRDRNGDDELRVVRLVERIGAPTTPRMETSNSFDERECGGVNKSCDVDVCSLSSVNEQAKGRLGEEDGKDFAMRGQTNELDM